MSPIADGPQAGSGMSPDARPYPRGYRLTKTDEFSSVFGFRRAIRGNLLMLHYQPRSEPDSDARLGLVIAKKFIRRAVGRNLVKRLVREAFRLRHPSLAGYDLVVRLMKKPEKLDRQEIAADIGHLLKRLRPRRKSDPTSGDESRLQA